MARTQAQADLCHVPTPDVVIERLRVVLDIPGGVRALDPCCGNGAALQALNPTGINYGVELDGFRAERAETRMKRVLHCALQDARVSNGSFGLLFLNPPYDASTEGRLESVFLDRCTRYLVPDGVLVLIIKEMFSSVLRRLLRDYDVLEHWRFPDPFFDGPELSFGQTCLIAKRRIGDPPAKSMSDFAKNDLRLGSLDPMPEDVERTHAVPIGVDPKIFLPGSLSEGDLEDLLKISPLASKTMPKPRRAVCGRPPLPLKQGHVSLVLASGMIDGIYGQGETLHIAKGTVERRERDDWEADQTMGGRPAMIQKTTKYFCILIRALLPNGEIKEMSTGSESVSAEEIVG